MARLEDLLAAPTKWTVVDTQTNATATATKAASAGRNHYITGISFSADRAPTAPVAVQLKDGSTVIDEWEVPASAFSPVMFNFLRPILITTNTAATLTCGAGGTSVKVSLTLRGFTAQGA